MVRFVIFVVTILKCLISIDLLFPPFLRIISNLHCAPSPLAPPDRCTCAVSETPASWASSRTSCLPPRPGRFWFAPGFQGEWGPFYLSTSILPRPFWHHFFPVHLFILSLSPLSAIASSPLRNSSIFPSREKRRAGPTRFCHSWFYTLQSILSFFLSEHSLCWTVLLLISPTVTTIYIIYSIPSVHYYCVYHPCPLRNVTPGAVNFK